MSDILDSVRYIPCHPSNHGGARTAEDIRYLVYHYTGNDGDHDTNNAIYYRDNVISTSAHYFVDDDSITRSVDDLTIAWAVGGTKWSDCGVTGGGSLYGVVTNKNSISIEMCDTSKDGALLATEDTMALAIELGKCLMVKYNIPIERVVRHFDVTGKHCPAYFMDEQKWTAFKLRLIEGEVMSKKIAVIPLKKIKKISIEFSNGMTMAQVKKMTGCDYIMNGGFFSNGEAVCHLKKNGKVYAEDSWNAYGYEWDTGRDIDMTLIPSMATKANYINGVSLIDPSIGMSGTLYYTKEVGGSRGRSAIAMTSDSLILWCSGDGTSDAKTPEGIRNELVSMGAISALMLDGGGSSQCDFLGSIISSSRIVNNFICVWIDQDDGYTHVVNAGNSVLNIRSGPSTSYSKLGFYNDGDKIAVIERKNGWGRTDKGWVYMAYLKAISHSDSGDTEQEPTAWYSEAQEWVKERGISDGTNPTATVTRAEVWTMFYRYSNGGK